ncbi:MAG: cytochrome c [Elusimicrobia bacterium]|nr:cytochrome c [Elusimicrobiota bacterium]
MTSRIRRLAPLAVASLVGCNPDMADQPRYEALEPSRFFADGRSARPLVEGAVARGRLEAESTRPPPVTPELLRRGRERFDVYCAVCHDRTGSGRGIPVQRGFPKPPSFHEERLRRAPPSHFFQVITAGFGVMVPYGDRVSARDRWAVAAYIRALQLSQRASPADADPLGRRLLEASR